ncbi:MAG TPA: FAD-dependent monooxygenase, partial [Ktedonobacterales bacterium]|nr:FAD-dependent monooxygenase [Ktedonobacterales bacterium]
MQPTQGDDRRVVVIGSGPCGAIAAYMLVRHGIPVTLLESGMHVPPALRIRAMGKTLYRRWPRASTRSTGYVASHDAKTLWFEALAPGGLSNYWTGAVLRFAPEDFSEGERLHECYRWPVGYDDLAPFYERVERLLVVEGGSQCVPNLPASVVAHDCHLPRDWAPMAAAAEKFGHGLTPTPLAN